MRGLAHLALPLLLLACDAPKEPRTGSKTVAVEPTFAPSAPDEATLALLDPSSRTLVPRSPVPVLVPKRPELLAVGKLMVEDNWYAFAATHDGLTISVGASRIEQKHNDIPPAVGKHVVRGVPGWVTRNESIWSASWREYGIHYSLDVECHEPTDKRCDSDALVLELARDLVYVGGRGGAK